MPNYRERNKCISKDTTEATLRGKRGPKTHLRLPLTARGGAKKNETKTFNVVTSGLGLRLG